MSDKTDLLRFRDWLNQYLGADYGVSEDQLNAVLDAAQAKRQALGYGSVYVMAADMLRDSAAGPW